MKTLDAARASRDAMRTTTLWSALAIAAACGPAQVTGESPTSVEGPRPIPVEAGCHDAESDPVEIMGAELHGDVLSIAVEHGGGCEPHDFRLCPDPAVSRTEPAVQALVLVHGDHGDDCRALIGATLRVERAALPHAVPAVESVDGRRVNVTLAE